MLGSAPLIAFVATTDPARARAFYGGTLGLAPTGETAFAVVFDAHGTMLRVTAAPAVAPAPYTVLGWAVPDLAAAMAELGRRGVTFERHAGLEQDAQGVWTTPGGDRVAWFRDPDGNVLSMTEFAAAAEGQSVAAPV
ncbi:MAG: VOC family protein [Candidatus Dormibacteraeota bacterium]|nr:VOC family protein [Candidatus Dormibacteraeota bacterium]